MNVRTLLQTLLYCDPDSPVALVVEGKPVPIDRVVLGGASLTAYLCDPSVENEVAIDAEEQVRAPYRKLGQLLMLKSAEMRQAEVITPPTIRAPKPVDP